MSCLGIIIVVINAGIEAQQIAKARAWNRSKLTDSCQQSSGCRCRFRATQAKVAPWLRESLREPVDCGCVWLSQCISLLPMRHLRICSNAPDSHLFDD